MPYDLKELAEKYNSLDGFQKSSVEIQSQGKVDNSWCTERLEDFNALFECSWFHFEKLGVKVGGDGRLRLDEGIISNIENSANKRVLEVASDYISDYFVLVSKYVQNPELLDSEAPGEIDADGWGTEEFLLGLINRRRGGDFDLFG
ncbi:hypothetical protein KGY77_10855 [Candidatus Bipolaricaulota bacterium]|nr:hypothetical protein [Candidatus Bipolaricaulota bacterium]